MAGSKSCRYARSASTASVAGGEPAAAPAPETIENRHARIARRVSFLCRDPRQRAQERRNGAIRVRGVGQAHARRSSPADSRSSISASRPTSAASGRFKVMSSPSAASRTLSCASLRQLLELVDGRKRTGRARRVHAHLPHRVRDVARQEPARLGRATLCERDERVSRTMPGGGLQRQPFRQRLQRAGRRIGRAGQPLPSRSMASSEHVRIRVANGRLSPGRTMSSGTGGPMSAGLRSAREGSHRRGLSR